MDIKDRVIQALKTLCREAPEVRILENRGTRVLAAIISPSFETMEDADRQSLVWGSLLDELGDYDSRQVEYVVTATPQEAAEANAATPEI